MNLFGKHCKVTPSRTKETVALCTVYRSKAEKALLSGLGLDATDADLWFVLGVLAPHKALKQHAFIQALRVDAYHAATWAHLGQVWGTFVCSSLVCFLLILRFQISLKGVVLWQVCWPVYLTIVPDWLLIL